MFVIRILDGDEKRYAFYYKENAIYAFRNRIRMYEIENREYKLADDVFIGLYCDNDCKKLIDSKRIYAEHPANVKLELSINEVLILSDSLRTKYEWLVQHGTLDDQYKVYALYKKFKKELGKDD